MQNRWSDSAASGEVVSLGCARDLALLTYATRLLGMDPDLAMHGGGNTSCKAKLRDVFGQERAVLFIKGSGVDLATISPQDFVPLDAEHLVRLLALPNLSDEAMADEFACHVMNVTNRRASVETLMHAAITSPVVLHTHPSAILALTNRQGGHETVAAALGTEVVAVPYIAAGLPLARAVREVLARQPRVRGMVLMHHGLVTWGKTAQEAYQMTIDLVSKAEAYLGRTRVRPLALGAPSLTERERRYQLLAPVIRGVLGPKTPDDLQGRLILQPLLDPGLVRLLDVPEGRILALMAPPTPDYLIRTRRFPLWLEPLISDDPQSLRQRLAQAVADFQSRYRAYIQGYGGAEKVQVDADALAPRVVMIPGVGVVCLGRNAREAVVVRDIIRQALLIQNAIHEGGATGQPLEDEHLFHMEFRAYQKAKLGPGGQGGPLDGSVALVTGAAGAIGSGICDVLLSQGCHVAAADLPGPALDDLVQELGQRYPTQIIAVAMDVTDPASVAAGFAQTVRAWGGVDGIIVNAGIAHVASLSELDLEAFRRLERVNVEGTLLVLAEAGRHLALQNAGGDVVLISTKNVFCPGAGFGAYSATKAAAHQLARIASLELAPLGVRVNMVAPDAVFSHGQKRSGLWAAVGPNRMKARGLDEHGLEEYYRSRNLLKARVTAEHVARAVLFFITHQTPTTGATIPVDGGLPDSTPR